MVPNPHRIKYALQRVHSYPTPYFEELQCSSKSTPLSVATQLVIITIVCYLMSIVDVTMKLYAEIPGYSYSSPEDPFTSGSRPDLVLETTICIFRIELISLFCNNLNKVNRV